MAALLVPVMEIVVWILIGSDACFFVFFFFFFTFGIFRGFFFIVFFVRDLNLQFIFYGISLIDTFYCFFSRKITVN